MFYGANLAIIIELAKKFVLNFLLKYLTLFTFADENTNLSTTIIMETKAYNGLMDFLCNALTTKELKRLSEQIAKYAKDKEEEAELFRPYTMDEINAMLDEAEANFEAGRGIPDEEAWDEEELALMEKYKPVLAEAV